MTEMCSATSQPSELFISYTAIDKDWAVKIAWWLEEAGHTTLIQEWDFRPGHNFPLMMQRGLLARHTLAILSPAYLEAAYCQQECAVLLAQDPKGEQRKLIPVRVRDCNPEGLLRGVIYVDLVDCLEHQAKLKLLDALRKRVKPLMEPPFPASVVVGSMNPSGNAGGHAHA